MEFSDDKCPGVLRLDLLTYIRADHHKEVDLYELLRVELNKQIAIIYNRRLKQARFLKLLPYT